MADSDDSFDYDEEISLESAEFSASDADLDRSSLVPATSLEHLTMMDKLRWMTTTNQLGSSSFRPLSVLWYIFEYFLGPARQLRLKILPHLSLEAILMILHYKKWLVDEATSDYFENWTRLRDAVGLASTGTDDPEFMGSRGLVSGSQLCHATRFSCPICCEAGETQVFFLLCGHQYCASCYRLYVELNLARGQLIRCMHPQCKLSLLYSDVELLLGVEIRTERPERITDKLISENERSEKEKVPETSETDQDQSDSDSAENLWLDGLDLSGYAFTECPDPLSKSPLLVTAARVAIDTSHSKYRWCPAVDCQNLVEIDKMVPERKDTKSSDLAKVPVVTCPSSHEFCFACQYENHLPCPCWLAASWIKRCEDDSETVNWIEANTQTCPKCEAVIEKNGGCNHMVCGKCTYEFCWICLGDWAMHKSSYWQCNRYDPKEVEELKKKQVTKANSLNRYLHFYKRFCIHQVSMEGDKHTLQRVHRCMLQYMRAQSLTEERSGSWNDIQYLADAIRSLSSGRKTLMWTYAFAFHLRKTNFSEIFEGMQDYLTKTVEDLSMLFEEIQTLREVDEITDKINLRKAEIVRLAALVTRRRELLINCANSGMEQGTLEFFTP